MKRRMRELRTAQAAESAAHARLDDASRLSAAARLSAKEMDGIANEAALAAEAMLLAKEQSELAALEYEELATAAEAALKAATVAAQQARDKADKSARAAQGARTAKASCVALLISNLHLASHASMPPCSHAHASSLMPATHFNSTQRPQVGAKVRPRRQGARCGS